MYGGQIKVKGNDNSEVISYHVTYKNVKWFINPIIKRFCLIFISVY